MKVTTLSSVIAAGLIITSILAYSALSTAYPRSFTVQEPIIKTYSSSSSLVQGESNNTVPTTAFALEGNLTLPDIFERTEKSVVQVTTTDSSTSGFSLGSGFVYDSNGYIITNNHVVGQGNSFAVTFLDGTIYSAKLVGSDPYSDLAVLSAENVPKAKLVPISVADSTKLRVGEQVIAIGNPFGLSGSMTTGIVSGLGRLLPTDLASSFNGERGAFSIPDIIQTDASINPGNSGGPLLNMKGEIVGITTAIYSTTGNFAGVGFAVPSNTITKVVPSIIKFGSFKHPWLGLTSADITPGIAKVLGLKEPRGLLVTGVSPDGPAAKAGIRGGGNNQIKIDGRQVSLGGDVITKIDDRSIRNIEDILIYLQREKSVGDIVKLAVLREGKVLDVDIVLGTIPAERAR